MKTKLIPLMLLLCGTISAFARPTANSVSITHEEFSSSAKFTAKVVDIDYNTRKVTVKTADGEKESFIAGKEVQRLNEIKKGDILKGDYSQTLAYEIKKGGKVVPLVQEEPRIERKASDKPEAVLRRNITTSVQITDINKKAPSVTVKSAGGRTSTVKVVDPHELDGLKVGDTVDFKLQEALSLKVESPKSSQNF